MPTTSQGEIIVQDFTGQNNKDNPFIIDDSQATVASNVIVTNRAVEIRGGFDLYAQNTEMGAMGGVSMMEPYLKRDGTVQLVFANQNKYYYVTPTDQTWKLIGTYGTQVDNPTAFQYKDLLVFGTGSTTNSQYFYDGVTITYTANTISFQDDDPDVIADSANGLGPFILNGAKKIFVTGSVSNDGEYQVASGNNPALVLVASDQLTNEAAGANVTITATGMTLPNTPATTTGDLGFYTLFSGKDVQFLIGAGASADNPTHNSTSLYFTNNPAFWNLGGVMQVGPSDGQDITGLVQKDNLVVYKERSKHYLDSFYEEYTGVFALRVLGADNSSGAPNHQGLVVMDGDVVSLTSKGRSIEGYGLEGTAQGNSRPKQYATYINPIIDSITWDKDTIRKSRGHEFNRLIFQAVPFNSSPTNNVILVGHWDTLTNNSQPSWTTWLRSAGSFATFRDELGQDIFLIGDALQPKIYKYNPNTYSDNTFGYRRVWRSKIFSLARRNDYNNLKHVIISGYIRRITKFKLKVIVDGKTQEYLIDEEQILQEGSNNGAIIGDKLIGSETIGGNSIGDDKFRYLAVAMIPNSLRYCKNVSVELSNEAAGQYWSMDYLSFNEIINLENLPARHKNLKTP